MRAFLRTVAMGVLAGAALPMIFVIVGILSTGVNVANVRMAIVFAGVPLLSALAFVLTSIIFVGLPVTALLTRLRAESSVAYITIGVVVGFFLLLAALYRMEIAGSWWVALLGAFSGGVTGRTWWLEARKLTVDS